MTAPVPSVIATRRNGPLIASVAKLWIRPTDTVLDVTYGRGLFWTNYEHPGPFKTHDLALDGVDFRQLPEPDGSVNVVVLDPPYPSVGGRSTLANFDRRHGLIEAPRAPEDLRQLIADGIKEGARVLVRGGRLLVKAADYISSGRYQSGLQHVLNSGVDTDLEIVDLFIHHSGMLPQPKQNPDGTRRRQVHSRRAHSYLVVFKKTAARA